MELKNEFNDGCLKISLFGELDHHSADAFLRGISRSLDDYMPNTCILDMSGVKFMDSSGIALILRIYKQLRQSGAKVCVEGLQRQPLKVLEAAGVDRVVKILTAVREGE